MAMIDEITNECLQQVRAGIEGVLVLLDRCVHWQPAG